MKNKYFAILIGLILLFSASLGAATMEEIYPEETVDMFLTAYCALAQNKGDGGYVILDDEMELISSWLSKGTSSDFFTSLPPSTLTVPMVLPIDMALLITSSLNDRASVVRLDEYRNDHQTVVMIMALKLYDTILLEETNYAFASMALEKKAGTLGLNTEELYSLFQEEKGVTKEELVEDVINGRPVDEIVMEALSIRNKQHARSNRPTIIMLSALIVISLAAMIFIRLEMIREEESEE